MTTVADILKFLDRLAPPSLMESWDNGGLLCGHGLEGLGCPGQREAAAGAAGHAG